MEQKRNFTTTYREHLMDFFPSFWITTLYIINDSKGHRFTPNFRNFAPQKVSLSLPPYASKQNSYLMSQTHK